MSQVKLLAFVFLKGQTGQPFSQPAAIKLKPCLFQAPEPKEQRPRFLTWFGINERRFNDRKLGMSYGLKVDGL
jgi:hypothetical protein